jgi:hypothetical protein
LTQPLGKGAWGTRKACIAICAWVLASVLWAGCQTGGLGAKHEWGGQGVEGGDATASDSGWRLAYEDTFESRSLSGRWMATGGLWRLIDGELEGASSGDAYLLLDVPIRGDVRVEVTARFRPGDQFPHLEAALLCNASKVALEADGYFASFGSINGIKIQRRRRDVFVTPEPKPEAGRTYRVRLERVGASLAVYVDDRRTSGFVDDRPITGREGMGYHHVGLYLCDARTRFDDFRVYRREVQREEVEAVTHLHLDGPYPRVAVSPKELSRLRAAWRGTGPKHDLVAQLIHDAAAAREQPVIFPPRGGQHNQWYQCDVCQIALETVDEHRHRCPKCGKVYAGPPYDDALFTDRHTANLVRARRAGWAWAVAGDRRSAEDAASILRGYAQRYLTYPFHDNQARTGDEAAKSGGRLMCQTLGEASSLTRRIAPTYDLIHDSDVLTAEDHKAIQDKLIRPMLEGVVRHQAGKSNWQTWHNAAMVVGGAVLGDSEWVRRGIDDPDHGFRFQLETSITPEGMWYENSWGYHFYALQALVATAEAVDRLGVNLWEHPRLRAAFALPLQYHMADGTLPRFGDATDTRLDAAGVRRLYERAWRAYPEAGFEQVLGSQPTFGSVLTGRPLTETALEQPGSCVFESTGHAILRCRGEAALTAAMTFGPHGGFHGHFDKLSFVFFGWGRELGVDRGRAASQAYRLPIHKHWYRASVSHNTVVVDGASQTEVGGELELFAVGEGCAAAAALCRNGYEGVLHRRLLVLTPTYLAAVDDLTSDYPRRFTWLYHSRGEGVTCNTAMRPATLDDGFEGAEYIQNMRGGHTDGPVTVSFADEHGATYVLLAAGGDTQVHVGDGPGKSVDDRVPLAAITRCGTHVRFAAVLEPVQADGSAVVRQIELGDEGNSVALLVDRRDGADRVTWAPGALSVDIDGKQTVNWSE